MPDEILHRVLSHLDVVSLAQVSGTSHQFRTLTDDIFLALPRRQLWHRLRHEPATQSALAPTMTPRSALESTALCPDKKLRASCADMVELCEFASADPSAAALDRLSRTLMRAMPASLRARLYADDTGLVRYTLDGARRESFGQGWPASVFAVSALPLKTFTQTSLPSILRLVYPASVLPAPAYERVLRLRSDSRFTALRGHVEDAIEFVFDNIGDIRLSILLGELSPTNFEKTLDAKHMARYRRLASIELASLCPELWAQFTTDIGVPVQFERALAQAVAVRAAQFVTPTQLDVGENYVGDPDAQLYTRAAQALSRRFAEGDLVHLRALHTQRVYGLVGEVHARVQLLQRLEVMPEQATQALVRRPLLPAAPDGSLATSVQRIAQLSAALPPQLEHALRFVERRSPTTFAMVLSAWLDSHARAFARLRDGKSWATGNRHGDMVTFALYTCAKKFIDRALQETSESKPQPSAAK